MLFFLRLAGRGWSFELLYALLQARNVFFQDASLGGVRAICILAFVVSICTGALPTGRLSSVAFLTL